jgi:hypothetical protein
VAEEEQFLPSAPQMMGTAAVVMAFIALTFIARRQSCPAVDRLMPGPWAVGATTLAVLGMPISGDIGHYDKPISNADPSSSW